MPLKSFKVMFIFLFVILIVVGCSNKDSEKNLPELVVEKHVEVGEGFERFKKVKDSGKAATIKDLIEDIHWRQGNPAWTRPADYQFYFEGEKEKYYVWLTPNKDQLEVEVRDEPKFIKLTTDKSETLYEIMTGEKLGK